MPEEIVTPQPGSPGDSPVAGLSGTVPQATPAAPTGPDSHSMAGLGEHVAPATPQVDYKARYDGMNAKYQADIATMKTAMAALTAQVTTLAEPPTSPTPVPVQTLPDPQVADPVQASLDAIKAQTYRNSLVDLYSGAGQAGEGLDLEGLKDYIPVVPVEVNDGQVDDSGQRGAIETFIGTLKKMSGETAQRAAAAAVEGTTPGSSPAPPAPGSQESKDDELYSEFKDLMNAIGSEKFLDFSKAEQDEASAKYYKLLEDPVIQERHGGVTRPSKSIHELDAKVTEIARQLNAMGNSNILANVA